MQSETLIRDSFLLINSFLPHRTKSDTFTRDFLLVPAPTDRNMKWKVESKWVVFINPLWIILITVQLENWIWKSYTFLSYYYYIPYQNRDIIKSNFVSFFEGDCALHSLQCWIIFISVVCTVVWMNMVCDQFKLKNWDHTILIVCHCMSIWEKSPHSKQSLYTNLYIYFELEKLTLAVKKGNDATNSQLYETYVTNLCSLSNTVLQGRKLIVIKIYSFCTCFPVYIII